MKKLTVGLTLLAFTAFAPMTMAQQIKIAAVDMNKVFSEYYKTKTAEAELKVRALAYKKEFDEKKTELQKMQEEGKKLQEESENPAYTDDKKAEKRKALEAKAAEFRLLNQQMIDSFKIKDGEIRDQQKRVRDNIVEEINKVIQDKAKRDGLSLVLDKSGMTLSGVPPFLYVQDSLDVTGDIIKALNASAPSGSGAAPAKPKDK